MSESATPFGVYVHVPFCAHRCDYCAFATYSDRDHLMQDYVESVIREIDVGARGRSRAGVVRVLRGRDAVATERRTTPRHPRGDPASTRTRR